MTDKIRLLIEKFWTGSLTHDEQEELSSLLDRYEPELRKDLEKRFFESISQLEITATERSAKTGGKLISIHRRLIWWVAASIVVAIAGFYLYSAGNRSNNKALLAINPAAKTVDTTSSVIVENSSSSIRTITLSDGSVISLAPGSSVTYNKHFDQHKRSVSLLGTARFKVAKDKKRPFTVYTSGLGTTALGTEFEVNATARENTLVKLYEGKVMVYSMSHEPVFETVYLDPGESVALNIIKGTARVRYFAKDKVAEKNKKAESTYANDRIIFEHEPLKNVFNKLSAAYNIRIDFKEEQVEGLNFSGYILKTDSVKNIITVIAGMNGLRAKDMGEFVSIHK